MRTQQVWVDSLGTFPPNDLVQYSIHVPEIPCSLNLFPIIKGYCKGKVLISKKNHKNNNNSYLYGVSIGCAGTILVIYTYRFI